MKLYQHDSEYAAACTYVCDLPCSIADLVEHIDTDCSYSIEADDPADGRFYANASAVRDAISEDSILESVDDLMEAVGEASAKIDDLDFPNLQHADKAYVAHLAAEEADALAGKCSDATQSLLQELTEVRGRALEWAFASRLLDYADAAADNPEWFTVDEESDEA